MFFLFSLRNRAYFSELFANIQKLPTNSKRIRRAKELSSRAKGGFSLKNKCKTVCCTCWPSSTIEQLPTRARCSSHKVGTSVQAHQRQTCHLDCRQFIYSFIDGYSYSARCNMQNANAIYYRVFWKEKKKIRTIFHRFNTTTWFVTSEFCFCLLFFFFFVSLSFDVFYFDIERKKKGHVWMYSFTLGKWFVTTSASKWRRYFHDL